MTSSRLVQFSKCEGFVSEAVRELCGNWMAWRHSIMRTYHLENGGIALLEKQLGEESSPSVSEELNAINQQIGACLVFSCFLGLE